MVEIPETPLVASGGMVCLPGLTPTSARRTMAKADSGASAQASLLDGSNAGELIPGIAAIWPAAAD